MNNRTLAIVGTVGVPGRYGGFEALAENLAVHHDLNKWPVNLIIYCSSVAYKSKKSSFRMASLVYIPLKANGVQSILYDAFSLFHAVFIKRVDVILLLGVSGTIFLPLLSFRSKTKIITNIDGIEWRREKWSKFQKRFLKISEKLAVKYSDIIIADNESIVEYVANEYNSDARLIEYGGDHVLSVKSCKDWGIKLPHVYAFVVCRIEPENNISLILEAFENQLTSGLVVVGNWDDSSYGRNLRSANSNANILLLDPIYDLNRLRYLRENATFYVHGHSAGGTNPSLVEAMHFGKCIIAFDCDFNRHTTKNAALYFGDADSLINSIALAVVDESIGPSMKKIAGREYTWKRIGDLYFSVIVEALEC